MASLVSLTSVPVVPVHLAHVDFASRRTAVHFNKPSGCMITGALRKRSVQSGQNSALNLTRPSRIISIRAQDNDSFETEADKVVSPSGEPATPSPPKVVVKELEKGQGTAIVTGAIAVLLGVGYLVLVQILDTRGTTLIPPPPEAFGL